MYTFQSVYTNKSNTHLIRHSYYNIIDRVSWAVLYTPMTSAIIPILCKRQLRFRQYSMIL